MGLKSNFFHVKVQTKILLLIIFVFVFFIISLSGFILFRYKQNELIRNEKRETQKVLIESVIKYMTKNLAETVNDFAVGNEIVKFVKNPDKTWAWENLLYILKFYNIDAIWVYNEKRELVYHANKIVGYRNDTLDIPQSALNKIKKATSNIFFMPLHNDFIQICGSTIHSVEDLNRIEDPKGYIFMGEVWNNNYLEKMKRLTGTSILSVNELKSVVESEDVDYVNTVPIVAYNGVKLTELVFIRDNPFLRKYNQLSGNLLLIFVCFAVIIIVLLTIAFRKFVSKPLGLIFKSLNTDKIDILKFKNPNDEFGKIAELIKNFYLQKQSLALQIDENIKKSKALEISERNFRSFIEQSSDGIAIFDKTGSIIEFNKALVTLMQVSSDDLISQKVWDLQFRFLPAEKRTEENYQTTKALLLNALNSQNISLLNQRSELSLHIPDGTIKYVSLTTFPIYLTDRFLVGTIISDITRIKQAELDITNALEKEMELHTLKNNFISTVSHEFRTPMTIIYSNFQLLEILKDNPAETEKCISRVYTAIKQMVHILDEVNLMNKDFAGRLGFTPQQVHFHNFCMQLVEDAKSLNKKIPIEFNFEMYDENIIIDPVLVQYIIINLLSNAIKYSREGEKVIFTVKQEDEKILMQIIDRGIGIPDDDIQRIFEPFHRADNVDNIKGTGLGMSIVKRSLELHYGKIEISSKLGEGSTMKVTIPFNRIE